MSEPEREAMGQAARMERQRQLMDLLSQETRHAIIQTVLGHPKGLASSTEITHFIPEKSPKAVDDQINRLVEAGILERYIHEPNEGMRDLPSQFYGLTVEGAEIVGDFGYFNSVPMLRAIHQQTRKDERVERHENAPRPELPEKVQYALRLGDFEEAEDDNPGEGMSLVSHPSSGRIPPAEDRTDQ